LAILGVFLVGFATEGTITVTFFWAKIENYDPV
jgi:hypothetical protein